MNGESIAFDEFEIDPARGELRRAGAPVAIEPQVLDLIAHLAGRPGQIVTRDELIAHVWGGRIVSDSAISTRINAARAALGDDGAAQRIIKTVPRRGFRFEAAIRDAPGTPGARDKPSVAVLPFQNLSGDPEQTYFSDGITDDIITDLARYAELFVIARHSSFAYRDSDLSLVEIAKALQVQYFAEGSVRRVGDRIRVTARLIDPLAGNELWAERYDRDLTDIFEVQDDIASEIVNKLAGHIARQHHRRSLDNSTDAVNAYDRVLRALVTVVDFDPSNVRQAMVEARSALEHDPGLARAHAVIAWAHIFLANNAYSDDTAVEYDAARTAALAGVAADDKEPYAHATLGWVYQWRDHAMDRAFAELDRAVELNPGSAHYRCLRAFSMTYADRCAEAVETLRWGMRLNPHYPVAYHIFLGRAQFHLEQYDDAMPHLERVRMAQPNHPNALSLVAACYAATGRQSEAEDTVAEVLRANPDFRIGFARANLPYVNDAHRQQYIAMLARAGLPE